MVANMDENKLFNRSKEFVETRLSLIGTNVPIKEGSKIIIHLIPENSLEDRKSYPIEVIDINELHPIWGAKGQARTASIIRITGGPSINGKYYSCIDLDLKGIVEAIDTGILNNDKVFPFPIFEERISNFIRQFFDILINDLKVETSIFFSLILTDIKDYEIYNENLNRPKFHVKIRKYQRIINKMEEVDDLLDRMFDRIKNAN